MVMGHGCMAILVVMVKGVGDDGEAWCMVMVMVVGDGADARCIRVGCMLGWHRVHRVGCMLGEKG